MRAWLFQVGRAEDSFCGCGEVQNAAHLLSAGCVGGKKRRWEEIWSGREFCAEVARFLQSAEADQGGEGSLGGLHVFRATGWHGPGVGQSSRVSTWGCMPSSYTIV